MVHEDLLAAFHRHIKERSHEFGVVPDCLPTLEELASSRGDKSWFAVPGMCGGFSYTLVDGDGGVALEISSWSRVVEGSGQRYRLSRDSSELIEEGFV